MSYAVNLWGSDPHAENDDCLVGADFDSLEEARAVYRNPWSVFDRAYYESSVAWFEIHGPDVYERRVNREYVDTRDADDAEWLREIAMQNGMAFGCQGYNDTYGW